jgi:hypothetical protein
MRSAAMQTPARTSMCEEPSGGASLQSRRRLQALSFGIVTRR